MTSARFPEKNPPGLLLASSSRIETHGLRGRSKGLRLHMFESLLKADFLGEYCVANCMTIYKIYFSSLNF